MKAKFTVEIRESDQTETETGTTHEVLVDGEIRGIVSHLSISVEPPRYRVKTKVHQYTPYSFSEAVQCILEEYLSKGAWLPPEKHHEAI